MIDLSHLNEFVLLTPFKMETVASVLLSVREGDFLASIDLKEMYFQITVSVVEEAIEVPVGGDSLSVQGPVLRTDCPPTCKHQGVCSCVWVGALPPDLSSQVPGRLAGPRLFGGGGQKERPGSALAFSLPQDRDKREVRSRTLADCKLPRYDHRQDFSVPCAGREISVVWQRRLYYVRSPSSTLAGDFGTPGFAGETSSSQSTLNALFAVAFEDALVSRVGSSLPPSAFLPGGE